MNSSEFVHKITLNIPAEFATMQHKNTHIKRMPWRAQQTIQM